MIFDELAFDHRLFHHTTDAMGHEDDHDHHDDAEDQGLVKIIILGLVINHGYQDGTDHTSPYVSDSSQNDHEQEGHHFDDGEIVVMEVSRWHMGKQCSCESRVEGADDEGQ